MYRMNDTIIQLAVLPGTLCNDNIGHHNYVI